MRIKHWQGYGTVNAKKISDDKKGHLVIEVSGNHEWGLERNDEYDVYRWLVQKFKKNLNDYRDIYIEHIEQDYKPNDMNGCTVEVATYYISYKI